MTNTTKQKAQNILIVDDVPKNIQLVASFLTKEGFEINFAIDGQSAIKHARKGNYDLILLDVMMPGTDGFEVCRQLKSDIKTQDIPVIFLTAKTDKESITKGFDVGGVDYITKPFSPNELLARVKTHLKLRIRERELKELNNTKNTILSIIGHDLKTPLANIISLGGLIAGNPELSEQERNDLIYDMVDSGNQGVWLLENLLSWTRIQSGGISLTPEVIDVRPLLGQNIEFVYQNAQHKGVQINSRVDDELLVHTDFNIVNTIFRNLLSNGIKFTHSGGQIDITAERFGVDEICICVKDNGVGIDNDKLGIIFSSVGKTSTDGTNNEKGSGLGLVLVKELVDLLGARIEVSSEIDVGTKFEVYFKEYKD